MANITKKLTAHELEMQFDKGKSIVKHIVDGSIKKSKAPLKAVQIKFTVSMISALDEEATRVGIDRQAVIKTLLDEALRNRGYAT